MATNKTKITDSIFWAAKTLFKGGASNKEVAEYLNISIWTVGKIKSAESPEEYRNMVAAAHTKKKEDAVKTDNPVQIVEHKQSVTVQTTHFVETKIDKIIELLNLLNNKLGFIVDDLTGVKHVDR